MHSVHIKARSTFTHEVPITSAEQYVEWQWKVDHYDVAFTLTFQSSPSESSSSPSAQEIHPLTPPIPSSDHLSFCSYLHTSSDVGILTFTFSNTHSSFRSKHLHYKISSFPSFPIPYGLTLQTSLGPTTILTRQSSDSTVYHCRTPNGEAFLESSFLLPFYPPEARSLPQTSSSINRRCMEGVVLFFTNHLDESEAFFRSELHTSAMFSISYACVGFLRALMTWEQADMAEANRRLTNCRTMVAPSLPPEGRLAKVGRLFGGGGAGDLTNEQLEATLMTAETHILAAILLLVQENAMSIIQAGLKIRQSHSLFRQCAQVVARREKKKAEGKDVEMIDSHVLGGIHNGMGTFSVILSLLPPIMLRLLSFLGFSSNRAEGLRLLQASAASDGIRAPLSSLVLLFLHVVIPSFFSIHMPYHIAQSSAILLKSFEKYPNGSFFLWLQGRQQRNDRRLSDSISSFHKAAEGQKNWRQLQHLCAYELGTTFFFLLDFEAARPWWEMLEKENQWSKGFYLYMLVIPLIEQWERKEEGEEKEREKEVIDGMVNRLEVACERKFGGKQLSLEQFCLQRSGEWKKGKKLVLPTLEIVYLYNGFPCMTDEVLQTCLKRVEKELEMSPFASTSSSSSTSELTLADHCLLLLLSASLLTHLRRPDEAVPHLSYILSHSSHLSSDFYLVPFAQFELATLHLRSLHSSSPPPSLTLEDVREEYRKASSYKESYHFKNRLHLRIHLAVTELKRGKEGGEGEMVSEGEESIEDLSEEDKTMMNIVREAEEEISE